jgi:membrane-associated phospholipid phosphatase
VTLALMLLLLQSPPPDAVVINAPVELAPVALAQPQDKTQDGEKQNRDRQDRDKTSEEKKPETPPHTGIRALLDGLRLDITHLPSLPNVYISAAGGAAALAVHPYDASFNAHLRSHYDAVNLIFAPGKYYGDTPEQVAGSILTYAWGRFFDQPKVSHMGMDLLRAQALAEIMVEPLKFATHRQRPDGSNYQSFPSGHSAVTFATATALERHLGWKKAALAYAVASYVAASRLHDNVHYLSDVVFGAAVGTIAGRTVGEHGRETWTSHWMVTPAPVPGGTAILVTRVEQ